MGFNSAFKGLIYMWFAAWLLQTRTTRANGPAVGNLSHFVPDEWKITCLVLFHKF